MEASPWEAAPLRPYLRSTMSKTQSRQSELVIEFRRYKQDLTHDEIRTIVSLNVLSFFLNHVTEQFTGCSAEETAAFPRKAEQSKQRQGTCIEVSRSLVRF